MEEIGLIPVFYNNDLDICTNIVKTCSNAGAKLVEFTNRGDGAIEVFKEIEKYTAANYPDVSLGAGSIIDASTAALYISYGANFIVGPAFDVNTALICNKRNIPYCPGCATATEIINAYSYGVDIVKIFPADLVGGPEFVKAIKGPCPWVKIMPTGGVNPNRESLEKWFKSGIVCAGIGSNLITKDIINNRDYDRLTEAIRNVVAIIKEIKTGLGDSFHE
jgi:2-dehydro-3-deoxyphosphogluconate aldolase/(4S)-4-hydroxy-2-oxoglutarate aldolase